MALKGREGEKKKNKPGEKVSTVKNNADCRKGENYPPGISPVKRYKRGGGGVQA